MQNNKSLIQLLMLLGLIIVFSGCVPKMKNVEPAVALKIFDAKSEKPLVAVLSSNNIQSNEEGQIRMPAKRELGLAFPMGGVYPIVKRFAIGKRGYVSKVCECSVLSLSLSCELSEVSLKPTVNDDEVTVETLKFLIGFSKKRFGNRPNSYNKLDDAWEKIICVE